MLKKKLILSEDIEIIATPTATPVIPKVEINKPIPTAENVQYSSMINSLIKGEWDAIELYNSMTQAFVDANHPEAVQTISDIVAEEYIHIGQLEKLLQSVDVNADGLEDGKAEFAGQTQIEMQPAPAPEVNQFAQPAETPAVVVPQEVAQPAPAPQAAPAPIEAHKAPEQPTQPEQPKEAEAPKQVDSEGNKF